MTDFVTYDVNGERERLTVSERDGSRRYSLSRDELLDAVRQWAASKGLPVPGATEAAVIDTKLLTRRMVERLRDQHMAIRYRKPDGQPTEDRIEMVLQNALDDIAASQSHIEWFRTMFTIHPPESVLEMTDDQRTAMAVSLARTFEKELP